MELSRASLGANLRPSDPTRSIAAARAVLPDSSGNIASNSNSNGTSGGNNSSNGSSNSAPVPLVLTSGASFSVNHHHHHHDSIAEEDRTPNESDGDDDESDRPMTKAELQKRAAKSIAGLQVAPAKLQPARAKAVAMKKKKL